MFGMITVSIEVRIVNVFVFISIWVRLNKTRLSGIVQYFSGNKVTPTPLLKSEGVRAPNELSKWHRKQLQLSRISISYKLSQD